jgi:hypothetical protein
MLIVSLCLIIDLFICLIYKEISLLPALPKGLGHLRYRILGIVFITTIKTRSHLYSVISFIYYSIFYIVLD